MSIAIPPRHEGRIAIVTTRGVGCGGRVGSQRDLVMRTNGPMRRRNRRVLVSRCWGQARDNALALRGWRGQDSRSPGRGRI